MRDALRGIVLGLVALALVGAIASRAGWGAISVPRPAGTGPWLLARASGYAAFVALSLDVIVGLLVSTRAGDRWMARGQLIDLHGWLSPLALGLVVGHILALLADRYIRFDMLDVLVPGLSPYRPVAVGLGIVAAYCAVVVHASFGFRRKIGTKTWRRLHYLSFVAFCAAAVHAFLAGTDASRAWAIAICAVPLLAAAVLLTRRLHAALDVAAVASKGVEPTTVHADGPKKALREARASISQTATAAQATGSQATAGER